MTADIDISEEFFRFKTYVQETIIFLQSIYDFLVESDADVENGDRLKTSALWKEIKKSLRDTMSYCMTLKLTLTDSKEPMQLEMLVNELRRNSQLVKLQREAFILETTPRFLGIPGARITSLESMTSTFWDVREMYDEMRQRNLTEEDAKAIGNAWVRVEEDWERLRKTNETVREGILERRYSITHLKLLVTYLSQSKCKLNTMKETFGRTISNLLLKDLETLASLENETGPIHLERAFYHHTSKLYLALKERCLVLIERVRTGDVISIQKFAFTIESMFMTLMDVFLNSNQEQLRARVLDYQPGKFLGKLYVTVDQLLELLRIEYDTVIASVIDCLTSLKNLADTFEAKGFANMSEERHRQLACAEEYSHSVLEDISSRIDSLKKGVDLEGISLKTVWLAKLFKYGTVKKLEAYVRTLGDVPMLPTDNFLSMALIARAVPDLPANDGAGDRLSLSEDFILGVLEQFLPPGTEVTELPKDSSTPEKTEKVVGELQKCTTEKVNGELRHYTPEKVVAELPKGIPKRNVRELSRTTSPPKNVSQESRKCTPAKSTTALQSTKKKDIKESADASRKTPLQDGVKVRREMVSSAASRKGSRLPVPISRTSSFFKRNIAQN